MLAFDLKIVMRLGPPQAWPEAPAHGMLHSALDLVSMTIGRTQEQ